MATFDGNAWYILTEGRVDFNSSLQTQNTGKTVVWPRTNTSISHWQFQDAGAGWYQIRNRESSVRKQLSACYVADEVDNSKTQPCMMPSTGDDAQKWSIRPFGDGSFYINNAANGSDYVLDVHPGNPMFMAAAASNLTAKQPAQRWQFSSVSAVDDGAYSTTFTNAPTSSSSSTPTSSLSPLSASGAANAASQSDVSAARSQGIGIGVGIGLGVAIFIAALSAFIIFFLRRRRRTPEQSNLMAPQAPSEMAHSSEASPAGWSAYSETVHSHGPPQPYTNTTSPKNHTYAPPVAAELAAPPAELAHNGTPWNGTSHGGGVNRS